MHLTCEQQQALNAMLAGDNVFLTGHAGTGKSFVVQRLKEQAPHAVFLAPTGLAAINIGGSTLHRFFGFPIGPLQPKSLPQMSHKTKQAIHEAGCLLIDEISMVRADLMQAIDERCRHAMGTTKPFGGKQIVVVGDFFQLPPVVAQESEEEWLRQTFGGVFAFHAPAWRQARFHVHILKTSHRQVADDGFLTALNLLREGDTAGLTFINAHALTEPGAQAVTLCTTNHTADNRNASALSRIKERAADFNADMTGAFRPTDAPAPLTLSVKPGARVMVVANTDLLCANGECGEVIKVSPKAKAIEVRLDSGREVSIERRVWHSVEYTLTPTRGGARLEPRITGSFVQFPLRLAWAMTIHKSQGQTLDNVTLDLGRGVFAEGQLYVALSRVRSITSLHLRRPLCEADVLVSQAVCDFFEALTHPSANCAGAAGWGGARVNAGRKPQWPKGTVLKTMRLPEHLEDELKRFALERITQPAHRS